MTFCINFLRYKILFLCFDNNEFTQAWGDATARWSAAVLWSCPASVSSPLLRNRFYLEWKTNSYDYDDFVIEITKLLLTNILRIRSAF